MWLQAARDDVHAQLEELHGNLGDTIARAKHAAADAAESAELESS